MNPVGLEIRRLQVAWRTDSLTRESVAALYGRGLLDLVYEAARVHRRHHDPSAVQCASLLSVKTGGCPEDCAYCPQSARYDTGVESTGLMSVPEVAEAAARARDGRRRPLLHRCGVAAGGGRPGVRPGAGDDRGDQGAGIGELRHARHARPRPGRTAARGRPRLLQPQSRYRPRLLRSRSSPPAPTTIASIRCGTSGRPASRSAAAASSAWASASDDRIDLLFELARQRPQPESVPINTLVAVEGTPLAARDPVRRGTTSCG